MKKLLVLFLFAFAALGLSTSSQRAAAQESDGTNADVATTVVELTDDGRALYNPGMGWFFYFYSNVPTNYGSKLEPSDTLDYFEGCNGVFLRIPWSYIEPEEGVYNWSILDTPAQRWIEKGKQVAFRFTTSENWMEYPTPKWVFDAGAKMERYDWAKSMDPNGPGIDPVFDDPIYLEKLGNFLKAAGARYDGNPHVAFVDVGTYGMWGEGHTCNGFWDPKGFSRFDPETTFNNVKLHIDLHKKYFPNTQLTFNDDTIGGWTPGTEFPEANYALEQGVTYRDDSILVDGGERRWFHDGLAQKFWPTMPVMIEHDHLHGSKGRGAWKDEDLIECVEAFHASTMSIHGWPDQEWDQLKETVRVINRRLGYRLLPSRVEYPSQIAIDSFFEVRWTLQNVAVAPCYKGGFVALTLKDAQNGIVSVLVDESFDVKDLQVAAPGQAPKEERTAKFRIGHVAPVTKPGVYDVYVSVGQRDGTPIYELPLGDSDGQRRYKIGTVELTQPSLL